MARVRLRLRSIMWGAQNNIPRIRAVALDRSDPHASLGCVVLFLFPRLHPIAESGNVGAKTHPHCRFSCLSH